MWTWTKCGISDLEIWHSNKTHLSVIISNLIRKLYKLDLSDLENNNGELVHELESSLKNYTMPI